MCLLDIRLNDHYPLFKFHTSLAINDLLHFKRTLPSVVAVSVLDSGMTFPSWIHPQVDSGAMLALILSEIHFDFIHYSSIHPTLRKPSLLRPNSSSGSPSEICSIIALYVGPPTPAAGCLQRLDGTNQDGVTSLRHAGQFTRVCRMQAHGFDPPK